MQSLTPKNKPDRMVLVSINRSGIPGIVQWERCPKVPNDELIASMIKRKSRVPGKLTMGSSSDGGGGRQEGLLGQKNSLPLFCQPA